MCNCALQVPHPSESVASKGAGYIIQKKWKGEAVRILITGTTGIGKSALANRIVGTGSVVVEEGDELKIGTCEVNECVLTRNKVKIVIWDTPGLQDTLEVQGECMKKMQRAGCGNADL